MNEPANSMTSAWQQEEKRRVVDEDHAKVPPAVAERRQLRVADARVELDREAP